MLHGAIFSQIAPGGDTPDEGPLLLRFTALTCYT